MPNFIIPSNCCRFVQRSFLSSVGPHTTRTSTFTSDNDVNCLWSSRNNCTSQAVLSASRRDRRIGVFLQTPANSDPSPSPSPPGETLIQHLKQNRKTCLSVWELSRLSLPSATRLYMQPCCCPGAGAQEQGTFSNSLTPAAVWETAGLFWLAQGERLMLPRLGKAVQTCTPKERFSARPGLCHPDRTAPGKFAAFQKQKSGGLFLPRLLFSCNLIVFYFC